tara:strand:- start:319 stop:927 length:609 start_codon:yes stop_codon:yes gene_type:complete
MRSGSGTQTWTTWQEDIFAGASNEYIILSGDGSGAGAAKTNGASFASTAPTGPTDGTGVYSAGNDATNQNGDTFCFWAFAKTPGLIASGTYTGNGSANGPTVVVDDGASGFKPAWVMVKDINSAQDWAVFDNVRNSFNPGGDRLIINGADGNSAAERIDMLANGFKIKSTGAGDNNNNATFIYLAFAERPFGGSGIEQARAG